jgi:hypothetical protein
MTSYATHLTPSAAPPRARTGPVLALVGGSLAAILALILLLGGSALLWADHYKTDDGYFTTDSHTYASPTRALVTESLDVSSNVPDWLDRSERLGRIRIDPAGQGAFVGIARTTDVHAYLEGVAHDQITDIDYDPFALDTARRAGESRPALPAAQTFWAATSTGGRALDWKVRKGEWSIVAMNADGSRGVSVDAKAGAKLPLIGDLGWWLAIPGTVIGMLSIALILLGARGLGRRDA